MTKVVILWLAAQWVSFADLLTLSLTCKEGRSIAARELANASWTIDIVRRGTRLLFDDMLKKKNAVDDEDAPFFFSSSGKRRKVLDWYVVFDILCNHSVLSDTSDRELAAALALGRQGKYASLKAYMQRKEDTASRFVASAVHAFLSPQSPRQPWWLTETRQRMIFGLMCKPFCCLCLEWSELALQNAHVIMVSEKPNVHLACGSCYNTFCAGIRRRT